MTGYAGASPCPNALGEHYSSIVYRIFLLTADFKFDLLFYLAGKVYMIYFFPQSSNSAMTGAWSEAFSHERISVRTSIDLAFLASLGVVQM